MKNRRKTPGAGILFVLTLPPSQRLEQATRPPHYADNPCFQPFIFFSWSYTFLHPSLTSDQPPDQKDAHSTLSIVGSAQSIARVRLKAAVLRMEFNNLAVWMPGGAKAVKSLGLGRRKGFWARRLDCGICVCTKRQNYSLLVPVLHIYLPRAPLKAEGIDTAS